jgi:hypothetical protein
VTLYVTLGHVSMTQSLMARSRTAYEPALLRRGVMGNHLAMVSVMTSATTLNVAGTVATVGTEHRTAIRKCWGMVSRTARAITRHVTSTAVILGGAREDASRPCWRTASVMPHV